MERPASAPARHCNGRIKGNRDLHCGNCDKKLSRSLGRVSQLEEWCSHCKILNHFDEPIIAPPVEFTPEQQLAREREITDNEIVAGMREAILGVRESVATMRGLVANFSELIGQRGAPRLVAASL